MGEYGAFSEDGSTTSETTGDEQGWSKIAVTGMNRLFVLFSLLALFVNYLQIMCIICRLFADYLRRFLRDYLRDYLWIICRLLALFVIYLQIIRIIIINCIICRLFADYLKICFCGLFERLFVDCLHYLHYLHYLWIICKTIVVYFILFACTPGSKRLSLDFSTGQTTVVVEDDDV